MTSADVERVALEHDYAPLPKTTEAVIPFRTCLCGEIIESPREFREHLARAVIAALGETQVVTTVEELDNQMVLRGRLGDVWRTVKGRWTSHASGMYTHPGEFVRDEGPFTVLYPHSAPEPDAEVVAVKRSKMDVALRGWFEWERTAHPVSTLGDQMQAAFEAAGIKVLP